jgi:5-formyltetrahydrofolate cyclo-ligase
MRQLLRRGPQPPGHGCEAARRWLAARPELRTVALYAAMPEEVDLLDLVAWDRSRRWVFPRICGDDLVFYEVREVATDLVPGTCGIREPVAGLPRVEVREVEVFLCPGLAFDGRGGRLGRGRGYYDRVLAGARPDVIKLGVCHASQRVADTFAQPHDVTMDEVLS